MVIAIEGFLCWESLLREVLGGPVCVGSQAANPQTHHL